jgi:hypothetical protein
MKSLLKKFNSQQKGQILVITILIMGLSGLLVVPMLNFMGTGITAIETYQANMDRLYAADAGIQKGIWQSRTYIDSMKTTTFSQTLPAFTVNDNSVVVQLGYSWPLAGIVNAVYGPHNEWLAMETRGVGESNGVYTLYMVYKSSSPGNKKVDFLGVWLPRGIEYIPGSCSDPAFPDNICTSNPQITYTHGGTSLKWDVQPNLGFNYYGETATQKFRFTPVGKIPKGDIAWVISQSSDIGLSWDDLVWDYALTSTATTISTGRSTNVTAHVAVDTAESNAASIIDYIIN